MTDNWRQKKRPACNTHRGKVGETIGLARTVCVRISHKTGSKVNGSICFLDYEENLSHLGGFNESACHTASNFGSIPSSYIAEIRQQMLWHRILANTSFFIATSVLLRTESPNFRFIIEKADSTLDRL